MGLVEWGGVLSVDFGAADGCGRIHISLMLVFSTVEEPVE
jgi:hypothetical protein